MSEIFKRTKTLATIGPATDSEEMIDKLIGAGLDNCRLNFSHGTYEKMDEFIGWIRKAAAKHGRHVAIVQDLQGPRFASAKSRIITSKSTKATTLSSITR